jgi:hypothetical protein
MLGFMQADGHLQMNSRNRGKLSIEIGEKDADILYQFKKLVGCVSHIRKRTRNTNFKDNYTSISWTVHDLGFRTAINEAGVPYGPKSSIIKPPDSDHVKRDYWRGIIDADGSVGITGLGFPFISLVTSSTFLAESFFDLIEEHCGYRPNVKPNKRDGIRNIIIAKEKAQALIQYLYADSCIGLKRKAILAKQALKWKRPENFRSIDVIRWSEKEVAYVLSHTMEESIKFTGRTKIAIEAKIRSTRND